MEMDNDPILIIGGGGHGLVMIDACRAAGYRPVGVLDKALEAGTLVGDVPVLGGDELLDTMLNEVGDACVAVAGDPKLRQVLTDKLLKAGFRTPSIAHSTCYVSDSSAIGCGSALLPGCIVNAEAKVGAYATLNSGCVVEHGCEVGSYSHIAPHAVLLGSSRVGDSTVVGANATVLPGVVVGSGCVVGAGSVVLRDVPDGMTVVGNPARPLERQGAFHE